MLEFWQNLIPKRDFYAGALLVLLGLLAVDKGPGYGIGTLMSMGPGFKEARSEIALCAASRVNLEPFSEKLRAVSLTPVEVYSYLPFEAEYELARSMEVRLRNPGPFRKFDQRN